MLPYSSSPAFPSPAPMRRQNSNQDQLDPGRPTSPPQLSQLAGDSPASPLPSISNLILLSEFIEKDISTNLIQMIPEISFYLEQLCLSHSSICEKTWTILKNLLETVQSSAKLAQRPKSPSCDAIPVNWTNYHGEEWSDDYGWLNDRENPEVITYIQQENDFSQKQLAHTRPLQKLLYKEFVGRLDESEESPQVALPDGFVYYSRKIQGQEYRVHCRSKNGIEDVYLDENKLANSLEFEDASFFRLGFIKFGPSFKIVAYSIDLSGNERYIVKFMMIDTKIVLDDLIDGVYEDLEFSNDSKYVYYTILDEFERAFQLKRHKIGTSVDQDQILCHELDEMFYLSLSRTCDMKYIKLKSAAQITSETSYISLNDSSDTVHLLVARSDKIQYTIEHHDGFFYILSNEDVKNNWLFRIPVPDSDSQRTWKELDDIRECVVEHRDFVLIEDFLVRRNHLIVFERSNCLQNVRIVDLRVAGFVSYHYVSFSELVYSLWPGSINEEVADLTKASQFDTDILRFTPKQVIDYNMDTRIMSVVHEEKVGGVFQYDSTNYVSKRLFATGTDGTAIPVSIVYRRDLLGSIMNPPQTNPLLLHGYGAYGAFVNPIFSTNRLSLLDRGFIYAVAHVRGGADLGNGWYEEGKLFKKTNTFYDFISVAEYLVKEQYTETEVPFVDVINTMFDSSIPWTAFEYEEWGNPVDKDIYDAMKLYCPYTNISGEALARNEYPNLLVVGGMNARMRGERRKYLDKVQPTNPEERLLLLRVDDVGHGGNSGQYSPLEDLAFEYAFLISALEASTKPFYIGLPTTTLLTSPASSPNVRKKFTSSPSFSSWAAARIGSNIVEYDSEGSDGEYSITQGKSRKKRTKEDAEEKQYRSKTKGDRSQNKVFQWVANFF